MDTHTFDIDIPIIGHNAKIYIDGKELKRVRRVQIDAEYDSATVVIIELFANVRATGSTQTLTGVEK